MNEPRNVTPGGPPPRLIAALDKVLRPMVKLMMCYQITYPQLIGMLKTIYVDVAEDEFAVPGKRQSDSRINLLTGVHRKDVKRLRAETRVDRSTPVAVSAGAQIIGYWLGDPAYTDADGNPRPLSVKGEAGQPSEFDGLVEIVCKQDIRPRVILDEWLRLGVARLEDDRVILDTGAFTPEKGFDEKVFFFGKNIQDHIAAGSHNLLGLKPSYFDRSVYYDHLSESSVQELSALADRLGMQALTEMNKAALAHQQEDCEKPGADYRMNFGIFNFNTEMQRSKDADPEQETREEPREGQST